MNINKSNQTSRISENNSEEKCFYHINFYKQTIIA